MNKYQFDKTWVKEQWTKYTAEKKTKLSAIEFASNCLEKMRAEFKEEKKR